MGLLDDAIREHLELKRLRGADPGDVARAEQDALGPVHRETGSEPDEHVEDQADVRSNAEGSFFSESESESESESQSELELELEPEPELVLGADSSAPSHVSQETVEINMEAELEKGIDVER